MVDHRERRDVATAVTARKAATVVAVAAVWAGLRIVFWTGCVGSDDLLYVFYAHELDRLPSEFWQFRMGTVLLTRLMLDALGPSEWAVCLPTLVASLAIFASVAWFVDWPRVQSWQTNGAVLLAAVMPLDVTMASYLVPTVIAAGFLAVGTVCLVKGQRRLPYLGSAMLALGWWTHEIGVLYVGILCLVCLAVDRRRYWRPVACCVLLSGGITLVESAAYGVLLDDPLARWRAAAGEGGRRTFDARRFGGSAFLFFLWPLRVAVVSKQFGFDLLLLFLSGALAWRHLDRPQRVLLLTAFSYWFWLGYGTQVPWDYRPRSRSFHYYVFLTFPIAALLPATLRLAFATRRRAAVGIVAAAIAVHVASLAAGGRWGQSVHVSRELLDYANAHPRTRFVTDWGTLREMYFANGLRLPANVGTFAPLDWVGRQVPGNQVDANQTVSATAVDALLVNYERSDYRVDDDVQEFAKERAGQSAWRAPVRYKPFVLPIARLFGREDLALLSLGGEVFEIDGSR